MTDYLKLVCAFCLGMALGNYEGDQLTFKDCATAGQAKMAGGGDIRCSIKEK